ncbi:hypothetical protein KZC51_05965 [Microbacterium sp. SSW1-49]|uniref:Uncharacterized protein n=1 Tax=Microbacterium croceum TaxID=2851645 RepID=A0ABT0FC87_9MICO|nr:hypothetical protein [Microbacterium croceum]MCK2035677.1 hypothetical protein [Microbacterium croceum]
MQFSGEEWLAFVSKLEQATSSGKLQWSGDDNPFEEPPGFVASIPGNAIYNVRSKDYDGEFPYLLRILTESGEEVAEFLSPPFDSSAWEQTPEERASQRLTGLYGEIVRRVTGAPQKAQLLLDGLDNLLSDDPF